MRSPSLQSRTGSSSIPAAEPLLHPADPAAAAPPQAPSPDANHQRVEPRYTDAVSQTDSDEPLFPPHHPPPPYAPASHGRCIVLPDRDARWRTKGKDGAPLSTLAATVLVSEGQLEGGDVELLSAADKSPTDPLSSIALSTYSTVHEIVLGAAEGPREAYRQLLRAREEAALKDAAAYDYQSLLSSSVYDSEPHLSSDEQRFGDYNPTAPPSVASSMTSATMADGGRVCFTPSGTVASGTVKGGSGSGSGATMTAGMGTGTGRKREGKEGEGGNPYAAVATSTGLGVARIVGAGLKAPGVYTRGLARGFNNVPRLYGDETVREEEKIDGVASGLVAAGKGLGYGLFDGITGLFVQPVKGAQKEGPVGFLKGFGKGLGGIVCKPAAGALGVPGYAFTGIQKSIEKELSRKASPEECLAAAEVLQGEDEMRSLSDKERMDIVAAWLAR